MLLKWSIVPFGVILKKGLLRSKLCLTVGMIIIKALMCAFKILNAVLAA